MVEKPMHIGEVAEKIGLSLRTIRYYEEVGLITPSARTSGGFRLYTDHDATRLQVVKDMKPLGFPLEEMRDLLTILDHLDDPETTEDDYEQTMAKLSIYHLAAEARVDSLRNQLRIAESFAGRMRKRLAAHRTTTDPPPDPRSAGAVT